VCVSLNPAARACTRMPSLLSVDFVLRYYYTVLSFCVLLFCK
jgi:hypothetical protein